MLPNKSSAGILLSRRLLVLALSAMAMGSGAVPSFADDRVIKKPMQLQPFSRVKIDLPANFILRQSKRSYVELSGESSVLDKIGVTVEGGLLTVSALKDFSTKQPLTVEIELTKLESLEVRSAADLDVESLSGTDIRVVVSGSADVSLNNLKLNSLSVELAGSGTASANGLCPNQNIVLRGSGDWLADQLESRTTTVRVNGSGSADVWATQLLSVQINDAGTVRYRGDPKLDQHISGAGTIERI